MTNKLLITSTCSPTSPNFVILSHFSHMLSSIKTFFYICHFTSNITEVVILLHAATHVRNMIKIYWKALKCDMLFNKSYGVGESSQVANCNLQNYTNVVILLKTFFICYVFMDQNWCQNSFVTKYEYIYIYMHTS